MELRDILLVLHIAGAGTWLGANIVQAMAPSMSAKQGPAVAAGWWRIAAGLSTRLYMPAAIVLLATGIWMVVIDEAYGFGTLFVTIGFAMIVIGTLLGIFVFERGSVRAADAIDSGDETAARAARGRLAGFGILDTLLMLFTITAMVLRLGA
ncbi:MAG TPA: DUF2269 family protein [Acidimicrobiia bacterium]|jgi:hypothetical protein|nr:DUF2269 family protein [Acidimicrobiia bacterium]